MKLAENVPEMLRNVTNAGDLVKIKFLLGMSINHITIRRKQPHRLVYTMVDPGRTRH